MARRQEESIAGQIVEHYQGWDRKFGSNIEVDYEVKNRIEFFGIRYTIKIDGKDLDVLVEPPHQFKGGSFDEYIQAIQTSEFWRDESLRILRQKRKKHLTHLLEKQICSNGQGNYHFRAKLASNNEDKTMMGIIDWIIKPTWLYAQRFRQQ